jgi:hypothetical protein
MRRKAQTTDAQLRIWESRDSGLDTRTRVYPSSPKDGCPSRQQPTWMRIAPE